LRHIIRNLVFPVYEKIVIGEDTWIGNCALIMANVGKKFIIGAGSMVTNDIEAFSIPEKFRRANILSGKIQTDKRSVQLLCFGPGSDFTATAETAEA
jgi:acetyltransferase-like isoleucine patch superfamily enzyme